ncbi:MAG TPA: PAS domain-containing sensor histidine kinase [Saprospiraceae bacterium]|nr:PAS domain-containing sensor histidine kinase [Saprospiraceae bacterium]
MTGPSIFQRENPIEILQSIVETAIDGIILIDEWGIVVMLNSAATRLFGYRQDEALGQNISFLMPSPHREHHDEYLKAYHDTGHKKIIGIGREIEGRRKNGSLFPARLAVSEMEIHGKKYFTGIIHDLTEMKAVEEQIMQLNRELEQLVRERTLELQDTVNLLLETNRQLNQSIEKHQQYEIELLTTRDELHKSLDRAKELNTLKSRFISMASHEFKTPLSSILSSSSLISKYNESDQVSDRQRHIDRIKSSVYHLNHILSDFLSVTRLDEGHFEPTITTYELGGLMEDLQSELEGLVKRGQELTIRNEAGQVTMVSDKNILRNILYNLLSNAIKYSNEGKPIHCHIQREGDRLHIEIKDEGIGIPPLDQKHIGSRFFRASNAVYIPGTGLGLNIVISYLHTLHGDLSFTSEEGQGTTFKITIPVQYEK